MTALQLQLLRAADAILAEAAKREEKERKEKGLPLTNKKSKSIPWSFFIKTPCGGQIGYRRR